MARSDTTHPGRDARVLCAGEGRRSPHIHSVAQPTGSEPTSTSKRRETTPATSGRGVHDPLVGIREIHRHYRTPSGKAASTRRGTLSRAW
ncbi:MAG: hypothetical protein LBJ95_02650 [Oscillospiraceae bacterium]|nr:hypothetical protein [Oscillospiraceae bacterium]